MENSSFKKIVFSEHPICQHIYLFRTSEFYLLFGTLDNCIFINKLSVDEFNDDLILPKKLNVEALHHDKNILGVFSIEGKYFGIDEYGCVFNISEEIGNDSAMDYDIFDDSPEKREKWIIKEKKIFSNGNVFNFCLTDNKIAFLSNSDHKLTIEVVDALVGLSVKSVTIRIPGFPEVPKNCNLLWIPPEETLKEFLKNWTLNFKGEDGIFVVSMPEGNILVVDPNESSSELLYTLPFPAISTYWHTSIYKGAPEGTLVFVTEGNSILKMSQYGEVNIDYLPIYDNVKVAILKQNILYVSDWSDVIKNYITDSSDKMCQLFLKGILCFAACEDFIFALSNNGEVYTVYDIHEPDDNEKILPESSMTAALLEETARLEKINTTLYEYDAYIEAINLSSKNLPFLLKAQIIYAKKLCYTICLSIKCCSEGILIEKDKGWNLFIGLKTGMEIITLSRKMRNNLNSENVFTDVFSFSTQQSSIAELNIMAKLIYIKLPDFSNYVPVIYFGELYLDPSYFLQPALEVELSEIDSQTDLNEVLRRNIIEIEEQDEVEVIGETKKEFKLVVEYNQEFPVGATFKWLLSHCQPLWRSSLWNQADQVPIWMFLF